jgi:hypothetical protein
MTCTNCGSEDAREYTATLGSTPTRELCKECLPLMTETYGITGPKVQETEAKVKEEPETAPEAEPEARRRRG